jgi:hypothetical protein
MNTRLWAAANLMLGALAGAWAGLTYAFRDECDTTRCTDWVTAEVVAVAATAATLLIWAILGRRFWPLLLIGTLALLVPAAHAFGLVQLD